MNRIPAAHEEWPAGPQHDRRCEHELQPVRIHLERMRQAKQVAAHFQRDDRQRQHETDPEASAHVDEFGIGASVRGCQQGLQRHAADRARPRADLADLGMHRTGVDRASWRRRRFGLRFQVFLGIGREFGAAAVRAEVPGLTLVVVTMLAGRGIDLHAADGSMTMVGRHVMTRRGAVVGVMRRIMRAAAAAAGVGLGTGILVRRHRLSLSGT